MKRVLAFVLLIVLLMTTASFADSHETLVTGKSTIRYTSVTGVRASLKKNGSSAICDIGVTQKIALDSVKGTLKLVDVSGKTVSTKPGTFKKSGSVFTLSKSFSLPKKGTYKVKYNLYTYKGGVQKETITGYTNTVRK